MEGNAFTLLKPMSDDTIQTLPLLLPGPIDEKPIRPVCGSDRADHDHDKTCGNESGKKPCDQSETAEGLADDDQESDEPGEAHVLGKKSHRPLESMPPEPAQ